MMGEKIKMLRMSQGLSQTDFAKRLFVTPAAVNQWEKGKTTPDTERLMAIARTFSVPLDFFSNDPDDKQYSEAELIKQHLLIELGALQPKTEEAKIISACIDIMPAKDRERVMNVFKAAYSEYVEKVEEKMA